MAALNELNELWRQNGNAFAAGSDEEWTMICPLCNTPAEKEKVSLVEAMNQAILHKKNCQASSC